MCDLVSGLGLGLQTGASLLGAFSSYKQEQAYSDYQKKSAQATIDNYLYQTRAINNRYAEETAASAIEQQQIAIDNMKAKATAKASAASGGVEGNSLDDLYRDYDRASAASRYIAAKNLHMKGLQMTDELEGLRNQAISSINLQQQYTGSTWSASLLAGIGTSLSGYADIDWKQQYLKKQGSTP